MHKDVITGEIVCSDSDGSGTSNHLVCKQIRPFESTAKSLETLIVL